MRAQLLLPSVQRKLLGGEQATASRAICFRESAAGAQLGAQTLDFIQQPQDELEAGLVHLAGGAQVFDAPERAQGLCVELAGVRLTTGDRRDEALLLVVQNRLRGDAGACKWRPCPAR